MTLTVLTALVRKDLQLFFTDRRTVIMSFAAPIAIASFFGSIFPGPSRSAEPARIGIHIADQDGSVIAKAIVARVLADKNLAVTVSTPDDARTAVRRGKTTVAVIIPNGFGNAAGRAFFGGGDRPQLDLLFDPSRTAELAMVRGILTEHVMQAVSAEMFTAATARRYVEDARARLEKAGIPAEERQAVRELLGAVQKFYDRAPATAAGPAGRQPGLRVPYSVREEAVTGRASAGYNGYAHSFAGMGVQFLLFAAMDLGMAMLLERQRGLWKRLRSAPISRLTLLGGKVVSGTIISAMTLLVSFMFAMLVFGVRIEGSVVGFLLVVATCAVMASTFGLLIAALGQTPGGTRGVAALVILIMSMVGGAWVPTFIFPAWLQKLAVIVPVRWAVDGLDAMTWRGLALGSAVTPALMLIAFAAVFGALAAARFRWEEA